jgi:CDP-4-dehydro-6-deoxyglucose reductase, E1
MLFAGNLVKQPCFDEMREQGAGYRVADPSGALPVTDTIMERSFWLGVYPGMTGAMLQFMVDTLREFAGR